MLKTSVLVSGGGTNLQALIDASARGKMQHVELSLVVSNRADAFAQERLNALLDEEGIGLIVLAGFLRILSGDFTRRWAGRIINIHPSLIPSFCGAGYYGLRVHEAALARGVKVTGATVHFVNEIPDGGEIIAQRAVEVLPGDTPEVLQRRVMEQAEWIILPAAAEAVAERLEGRE